MKQNIFKFVLFAAFGLFFMACDEDDVVNPTANFSYEVDGLQVTFTNTSKDAVSYDWNFGDNNTSTEKDPVHTYSTHGTYTVVLTAKSSSGETATKSETISFTKPLIVLDGNFGDWSEVPSNKLAVATLNTETSNEATLRLKEMKFCADEMFIYMYMKMDTLYANAMDIYLNIDGNADNGYMGWMWQTHRADYLMQGFKAANYDMRLAQYDESKGGGWGWLQPNIVDTGMGLMTISEMKTVSGSLVEFEAQIIREFIPNLGNEVEITIGHSGVSGDAWTTSGGLPTVTATGDKNRGLILNLN